MINDNEDKYWPSVKIVDVKSMSKTIPDNEPFQQKIDLSCGHWLYNTFGDRFKERKKDETIGCRNCFLKSK